VTDALFWYLFAGFFAVVTIWQTWAWALLLPCLPAGMLLRRWLPRGRALLAGGAVAVVAFAANTGVIGATLQHDPDFAAGVYPPGFLALVLALCWLLHTLLACLVIGTGAAFTEIVLRARRPVTPTPPRRGRGTQRR